MVKTLATAAVVVCRRATRGVCRAWKPATGGAQRCLVASPSFATPDVSTSCVGRPAQGGHRRRHSTMLRGMAASVLAREASARNTVTGTYTDAIDEPCVDVLHSLPELDTSMDGRQQCVFCRGWWS